MGLRRRKPLLVDQFGQPMAYEAGRGPARYIESAETTRLNQRHWQHAGTVDMNAAILPRLDVLRNRAKYELLNNGYARGIVKTYADDLCGQSGPTLQILVDGPDRSGFAQRVEDDFAAWCENCDVSSSDHLVDILRMQWQWLFWAGDYARQYVDGPESAAGVRLRLLPIAPERIATPPQWVADEHVLGGVRVDENGCPQSYFVLKRHPGAFNSWLVMGQFDEIPARDIDLVFEREEAGQVRGLPKLGPVLDVFGHLRSFMADTMTAARVAAMLAGFLETNHPEAEYDALDDEVNSIFDIEPGTVSALPSGWKFSQSTPQHPSTTFKDFKREMLSEAGRPIGMPWLRIGADAAGHTFSSARLDLNTYWAGLRTMRGMLERGDLNRLFARWFAEWRLMTGRRVPRRWSTQWGWEPAPQVDELKAAEAAELRVQSNQSCLRDELATLGRDWRDVLTQRAAEQQLARELGLSDAAPAAAAAAARRAALPAPATDATPINHHRPGHNGVLSTGRRAGIGEEGTDREEADDV